MRNFSSATATSACAKMDDTRFVAWMNAAQAGDRSAYENILRTSIPFIRMVVRRRGVPKDLVDDVVQETLIAIHRTRASYDSGRSFMAWLRTIAQRRAIDLMRSEGRIALREVHEPIAIENHPDPSEGPDGQTHQDERKYVIGSALAALPDRQRQALEQIVLAGKSPVEAAAATGMSRGAVNVYFHRALKTLRARVRDA